ncbi:cell death abnormality protein 1-like [Haliotis cracherodii]|uniref:cell death abnormality protein 1-like n=1 Tax=Haliotis cracherodii TaxID=6455 RepID=UPI0039EAE9F4
MRYPMHFAIYVLLLTLTECGKTHCGKGKWGPGCKVTCPENCLDLRGVVHCDINRGECYEGCIPGWCGDLCNISCNANCIKETCDQDDGSCSFGCKPGHVCKGTVHCESCQQNSGVLISLGILSSLLLACLVTSNIWFCMKIHKKEQKRNSSEGIELIVLKKPYHISTCSIYWYLGYPASTIMLLLLLILQLSLCSYASGLCHRNCLDGDCTRKKDGRAVCIKGCDNGFWGTKCRIPCPEHCEICHQYEGTCIKCNDDVFGDGCSNTCDAMCSGFDCDKDGTCFNTTCQDGWHGQNCSKQCNQTFLRCGKTDGKCIACKDGFYGMSCELGCPKYGLAYTDMQHACFPGCKDDSGIDDEIIGDGSYFTCTSKTLKCLNHNCTRTQTGKIICAAGCDDGLWGTCCRIPCPGNCQACERLVDKCTKCKHDVYGLFCNLTCQELCHGFQCNQTGACSETVCTDGRYGDGCSLKCDPRYKTCNRTTGHCIKCKENYYGEFCKLNCPRCGFKTDGILGCEHGCNNIPCTVSQKPTETDFVTFYIVLSGTELVIFIAVLVLSYCRCRRTT